MPKSSEEQNLALVENLAGFTPETAEQATARQLAESEIRTQLKSLKSLSPRRMNLQSRAEVLLDFFADGEKQKLAIPIKSIPSYVAVEIGSNIVPPDVPQKRDAKTGEIVDDRTHRDYAKARAATLELDYRLRCLKVLHGLDIDIESADKEGEIVWSRDESGTRDVDAAIDSLEVMGFTTFHLQRLSDEIDRISGQVQAIEQEETEKKS